MVSQGLHFFCCFVHDVFVWEELERDAPLVCLMLPTLLPHPPSPSRQVTTAGVMEMEKLRPVDVLAQVGPGECHND